MSATAITTFRKPLRVILGDRDATVQLYSDTALDDAVEVAVNMGKINDDLTYTTDGTDITPAIGTPDLYALLVYEVVKMFVAPNPDSYSFRTRALSESFGAWKDFLFEIEQNLHRLRNGEMFGGWNDLYSWMAGIARVPLAELLSDVTVDAPLSTLSI